MTTVLVISSILSFIAWVILYFTRDTMNEFTNLPADNRVTLTEFWCCFIPCCNLFIILSIAMEFIRQWHTRHIQSQRNKYFNDNTLETILDNK